MTDDEWKNRVSLITDPIEMLKCIVENRFFWFDPYYADLRQTMLDTAGRIANAAERKD